MQRWGKVLFVLLLLATISAPLVQKAFASLTLNATLPPGTKPTVVVRQSTLTGASGTLKFLFTVPKAGNYAVDFCIGPATNPCGLATSYVVQVMGGGQGFAIVDASVFNNNVLVAVQGTNTPIPISVTLE